MVYVQILGILHEPDWDKTQVINVVPSPDGRTDRANEPDVGTIPTMLLGL